MSNLKKKLNKVAGYEKRQLDLCVKAFDLLESVGDLGDLNPELNKILEDLSILCREIDTEE